MQCNIYKTPIPTLWKSCKNTPQKRNSNLRTGYRTLNTPTIMSVIVPLRYHNYFTMLYIERNFNTLLLNY